MYSVNHASLRQAHSRTMTLSILCTLLGGTLLIHRRNWAFFA
jgi:hypothetical protein